MSTLTFALLCAASGAWLFIGSIILHLAEDWHIKWRKYDGKMTVFEGPVWSECLFWPILVLYVIVEMRHERFRFWPNGWYWKEVPFWKFKRWLDFRNYMHRRYIWELDQAYARMRVPPSVSNLDIQYYLSEWRKSVEKRSRGK